MAFLLLFGTIALCGIFPVLIMTSVQKELEDPYDERMRQLQNESHKRSFIMTMVFAGVMALFVGVRNILGHPQIATTTVFLYWIVVFGWSVLMADLRLKGVDIGRKANEKTYRHIVWVWVVCLVLPLIGFFEDGFRVAVSFPLTFWEGMVIGNVFLALSQVIAFLLRNRIVKKEESDDADETK